MLLIKFCFYIGKDEVAGSNPAISSFLLSKKPADAGFFFVWGMYFVSLASLAELPFLHSRLSRLLLPLLQRSAPACHGNQCSPESRRAFPVVPLLRIGTIIFVSPHKTTPSCTISHGRGRFYIESFFCALQISRQRILPNWQRLKAILAQF